MNREAIKHSVEHSIASQSLVTWQSRIWALSLITNRHMRSVFAGTTGPARAARLGHPFLGEARAGSGKKKNRIPRGIPREVYRSHAWNRIHRYALSAGSDHDRSRASSRLLIYDRRES